MKNIFSLILPKDSDFRYLKKGRRAIGFAGGDLLTKQNGVTARYVKYYPTVVATTPVTTDTITATATIDQVHYITPAGTIAALTFTLPAAANSRVGQMVTFLSTQTVTALTLSVSGSGTIAGVSLTAMVANTAYLYQCVSTASTGIWIRVK